MNLPLQTIIAVTIVAFTIVAFFFHWLRNRKKAGCGGRCGCSSAKLNLKK